MENDFDLDLDMMSDTEGLNADELKDLVGKLVSIVKRKTSDWMTSKEEHKLMRQEASSTQTN